MSKSITIPKDRDPFVVIVNGVEYKYPAGATLEVPDAVADVIEKYEGAKPKPDPNAGINFGGAQSDWNQNDSSAADFIKNKPFGDMPTGGDTLYWDGNTEGLLVADGTAVGSGVFYRISDRVFSYDEAIKATGVDFDGNVIEFDENSVIDFGNGLFAIAGSVVVVPYDEHTFNGIYFPTAGVWSPENTITSLTIPGYTGFPVTKKMEEKYLPGAVILYADDALTYLYNSSDITNTENRMTLAKLKELVLSGIPIQVLYSGFIYCMATNFVDAGDMGGFGMLSILMEGASTMLYTAEYVPEG